MITNQEVREARQKALKVLEEVKKQAPKAKMLPKGASYDFKIKKK